MNGRHTDKVILRKHRKNQILSLAITMVVLFALVVIYLGYQFDSLLDFLVAVWTVIFLGLLSVCITAIVGVLIYDVLNHE